MKVDPAALKPLYTRLTELLEIGIAMQADRDLVDGPIGEDRALHLAKLREAGDRMRQHQTEAMAIRDQLAPMRAGLGNLLARQLYAASVEMGFVVCLSQTAYDQHLPLAQQYLEAAAARAGWA